MEAHRATEPTAVPLPASPSVTPSERVESSTGAECSAHVFHARMSSVHPNEVASEFALLPKAVQMEVLDIRHDHFFATDTGGAFNRSEAASPSGEYRIVITSHPTIPGYSDFTRAIVFKAGSALQIAEVRANSNYLFYRFIENHSSGHPLLLCAAAGQSETIIDLKTGARREVRHETEPECDYPVWQDVRFHPSTSVLTVRSYCMGCPPEFRFYDLSDPMSGWPELAIVTGVEDDVRWPEISGDCTITCFRSAFDENGLAAEVLSTKTLAPVNGRLFVVADWASKVELQRRAERVKEFEKQKEWLSSFTATDPLFLLSVELMRDPSFNPTEHFGIGTTYENWCDTWCPPNQISEHLIYRRIINRKSPPITVDLEWAAESGPIKLQIFSDGTLVGPAHFFDHSPQGMQRTFEYAKELLTHPVYVQGGVTTTDMLG